MNSLKHSWWSKSDYLLILGLVIIGLIAWLISRYGFSGADTFIIKTNNNGIEAVQSVALDSDKTIKVNGKIGEMLLEFNCSKGVRVASSTCPCQICVNSGWSFSEALICVPNGVIVQPEFNSQKSDKADAVTR